MSRYDYLYDLPVFTDLKPVVARGIKGEFYGPEESAGPLSEGVAANMWRDSVRAAVKHTLLTVEWGGDIDWRHLLPGIPDDLLPLSWGLAVPRLPERGGRLGRCAPYGDLRHSLAVRVASRLVNMAPSDAYWWIERGRRHEVEWAGTPSMYPRWVAREWPDDVRRCLEAARSVMRGEL